MLSAAVAYVIAVQRPVRQPVTVSGAPDRAAGRATDYGVLVMLAKSVREPGQRPPPTPTSARVRPRRTRRFGDRLFGRSDPFRRHREVRGKRAKVRWWHRVRGFAGLAVLIPLLGLILAVVAVVAFLLLNAAVEIAVG